MKRSFEKAACTLPAILAIAGVAFCTGEGHAQVVQLPSVGVTSVGTTVSVPDGGSVSLGGIGRSSSGSTSRGIGPGRLLGNRAIGSATSAGNITAHATILDMAQLDEAVLAEGRARRALAGDPSGAAARRMRGGAAPERKLGRRGGIASGGIADTDSFDSPGNSAARSLVTEAERAIKKGRKSSAEVYLQMAEERADGDVLLDIQERLAILRGEPRSSGGATIAAR